MVDDQHVFAWLKKQKKDALLVCLRAAFDVMNAKQRRIVFADVLRPEVTTSGDGDKLRAEIEKFRRDSLARKYYAPFNVNSKNFMDVPEKTEEWCDRFVAFVSAASRLTISGEHTQAVGCFALLFELVEAGGQKGVRGRTKRGPVLYSWNLDLNLFLFFFLLLLTSN